MSKVPVAILISGRGSNMAALIEAAQAADYSAEILLVISERADAGGLTIAQAAGIPIAVVPYRGAAERDAFEAEIDRHLHEAGISLICLAGFMRVFSAHFVEHWHDRMLNIHPSLLPDFPGLDTHARALAAKVNVHGCTVHFVRAAIDSGPIVLQGQVPVWQGDTPDSLAARVLEVEHQVYPLALEMVASGNAKVTGDSVDIDPGIPEYLTGHAECGHRH